jgi:hypothetical protein
LRLPTFGFRVVMAEPSLTQATQAAAFQKEWEAARRTETTVAGKTPLQLLERLLKEASPAQREALQAAIEQLNGEVRKRNELEARAAKSLLSGALSIRINLVWTARYLDQLDSIITVEGKQGGIQADLARQAKERFDQQKPNFDGYAAAYADLVQQLATDFRPQDVAAQTEVLRTDLASRRRGGDHAILDALLSDIERYRSGAATQTGQILRSVVGPRPWLAR